MTRKYCPETVIELTPQECFVFGSNSTGFHGAGAAGLACRGDHRNTWRKDPWFLEAIKAPEGSPKRIGKWAVFGVARGFQRGLEGYSYAIETIKRPGQRKSTPLSEILSQFYELTVFAKGRPDLQFLMTISGGGYNGWSVEDIKGIYKTWCAGSFRPPDNILIKRGYEFRD